MGERVRDLVDIFASHDRPKPDKSSLFTSLCLDSTAEAEKAFNTILGESTVLAHGNNLKLPLNEEKQKDYLY